VFLDEVCKAKATSVAQVRESLADLRSCQDSIKVRINDDYSFLLDQHFGDILRYSDSSHRSGRSEDEKMLAFRYSAEVVFAMTTKILGLLGQPQDRNQYEVEPALKDPGRVRDGQFGLWVIVHKYTYNNLPCRNRFFSLTVFPEKASVQVKYLCDYPIVTPEEEPERPITKDEAVSAVQAWFVAAKPSHMSGPRIENDVSSKIQEVLALPNACFALGKEDPDCRGAKAQCCWEVPFSWEERPYVFNGVLWVSLKTGQVIGGTAIHKVQ
jgi:hypothetical protein